MSLGKKAGNHFAHLRAGPLNVCLAPFTGDHGWKRLLHFYEQDDYLLDLSHLQPFGRLGEVLFEGALMYAHDKRRDTVIMMRCSIVRFSHYLRWLTRRGDLCASPKPSHLTSSIISAFAKWLTNQALSGYSYSTNSAAIMYGYTASSFRFCVTKYPAEFRADLSIASNPLGYSQHFEAVVERAQALDLYDYKAVQDAASEDALAIVNDSSRGDFPKSREQLLPFYILILLRTCTNPSSAAHLRRDCLEKHPFENRTWLIHFQKPRAGTGVNEDYTWFDYEDRDPLSPLNIIHFLLKWTATLSVAHSKSYDRVLLFAKANGKGALRVHEFHPKGNSRNMDMDRSCFSGFAKRHSLKPFRAKILRESAACQTWLRTRSAWQVKSLLNHKHFVTTGRYLMAKQILDVSSEEISRGTTEMTKILSKGQPIVRERPIRKIVSQDLRLSDTAAAKIVTGEWHTGLGGCTDPMNSPMPNQVTGKLCTAFWACIFCPRAVFALEHLPLLVARQDSVKAMALTMNAASWASRYKHIELQLTEIINGFSKAAQSNARAKVSEAHLTTTNSDVVTFLKTPISY